ncbi:unnamed protein product [Symbiodinium natans]|uniref:Uncharacterized protein n=1 Tax=Symbiodinium natans TaxID=878477 RepID=A0A812U547_9DINO|nr:unnamed protein product [Symbiodinium natans]
MEAHDGDFQRLFLWPREFVQKMATYSAQCLGVLVDKYRDGLSIVTDFSGVGSVEIACSFIEHGLRDSGQCQETFSSSQFTGLHCQRASDSNPACRKILMLDACSHEGEGASGHAPGCVFGSLEERIAPEILQKLHSLQATCVAGAESDLDGVEDATLQKNLHHRWGRQFLKLAVEALQDSGAELPATVWCHRHQRACRFHVRDEQAGATLAAGGPPCIDWSQIGLRLGWLGRGAIPFLLWAHERWLCRERIILMENVPGIDHDSLSVVFPCYHITVFTVSLAQFGIPANRERVYIVMLLQGTSWLLQDPEAVFREIFTEEHLLSSACQFFSAPQDIVDRNHSWQAVTRGLPGVSPTGRAWQAKHVMSMTEVKRVRAWEERVRGDLQLGRNQRADVYMNASQSAERCGVMYRLPTLITNAHIWSMRLQRLLLIPEMWEVQGFAMFEKGIPSKYMCPFRSCVLDTLAAQESTEQTEAKRTSRRRKFQQDLQLNHQDLRVMVGNSMSLQSVGAILLFTLAFVR